MYKRSNSSTFRRLLRNSFAHFSWTHDLWTNINDIDFLTSAYIVTVLADWFFLSILLPLDDLFCTQIFKRTWHVSFSTIYVPKKRYELAGKSVLQKSSEANIGISALGTFSAGYWAKLLLEPVQCESGRSRETPYQSGTKTSNGGPKSYLPTGRNVRHSRNAACLIFCREYHVNSVHPIRGVFRSYFQRNPIREIRNQSKASFNIRTRSIERNQASSIELQARKV